jgi:hypothetical protein
VDGAGEDGDDELCIVLSWTGAGAGAGAVWVGAGELGVWLEVLLEDVRELLELFEVVVWFCAGRRWFWASACGGISAKTRVPIALLILFVLLMMFSPVVFLM